MFKIYIHFNDITKNNKLILVKSVTSISKLKSLVNNKFRIKAKRLFYESGEEINDVNIKNIYDECNIIFTKGNDYKSDQRVDNNKSNSANVINVKLVAKNSYVSHEAIKQLNESVNRLDGIIEAFGMPDLHAGGVGVRLEQHIIHPSLIGTDIGCGMSFYQSDIINGSLNLNKLKKKISSIDKSVGNVESSESDRLGRSTLSEPESFDLEKLFKDNGLLKINHMNSNLVL